jgi:transketolase
VNRLGQRGETELGWNTAAYAARIRAFGWHAIEIDGHDVAAIDHAYAEAVKEKDRPTCVVARTVKGSGVTLVANKDGWHGKALNPDQAKAAIAELGGERRLTAPTAKPEDRQPTAVATEALKLPAYPAGGKEATRKAYGDSIAALGAARSDVVALDAEVSNSTYAEEFKKAHPDRFFEMFISEQQLLGATVGLGVLGKCAFASTFAAFFTRAYDQIRMAAISNATIRLSGSHAGVGIGEDGPSQMALEDLAMMRAVFGSTVLYPCDANQAAQLVKQMADLRGISYLRTTREKTPILYGAGESFPVGGSRTLRASPQDRAVVVGAGITVHEALKAYERLKTEGIAVRVIDAYCVKPIDAEGLRKAASEAGGRLVVAEDHWPEGGLGDAVLEALAGTRLDGLHVVKLGVKGMPGSGTPAELLHAAGIDADCIARAVKAML